MVRIANKVRRTLKLSSYKLQPVNQKEVFHLSCRTS